MFIERATDKFVDAAFFVLFTFKVPSNGSGNVLQMIDFWIDGEKFKRALFIVVFPQK